MDFMTGLFLMIFFYVYSFCAIRWLIKGIKNYVLSKTQKKKRKEGQTFKEWFLYTRYREEIPTIFIVLYFLILLIHPVFLTVYLVFHFMNVPFYELHTFVSVLLTFDVLWLIVVGILFWSKDRKMPYSRWIDKDRVKKNRKNKRKQ